MKVLVAGASGAIGQPLVAELIRQGHTVTGISRSIDRLAHLARLGAHILAVDVFDAAAVEWALRESEAEAVIDELTSLPRTPAEIHDALPGDRKVRIEGGGNLHRAAQAVGVRRYLQQSTGFFLAPASGLGTEYDGLAVDAGGDITSSAKMYTEIERRLFSTSSPQGTALRYGFFYGPGTWYHPDGATADAVRAQQFPIVGDGGGVWSFVHVEDAAAATVAALTAEPGIYNIVDNDPLPVRNWLPEFARWVNAPAPPRVTEEQALGAAGVEAAYYGTRLHGASNEKARRVLNFHPRKLEWLA
jgi:2-alkyl-3-oxoalkanoate reductase